MLADTNIGFGVFVRDPDGQLLELLPMSYRDSLARARAASVIAGGLERAGEQRGLRPAAAVEAGVGSSRGRAVLVGNGGTGVGRRGRRATPRRSSRRQPCGGVSVFACRSHSSPARALPSRGASSHTVCSRASKVNVAVATALHPERAHCRCTDDEGTGWPGVRRANLRCD